MIEFFANSVLEFLREKVTKETKIYVSYDSENAICFEASDNIFFWKLTANLETNNFELQEVSTKKNLDLIYDITHNFETVADSIAHIVELITEY